LSADTAIVTLRGLGWPDVVVSLVVHGALVAALLAARGCATSKAAPILARDETVIEVSMAVLPKSTGRFPDRATRAPDPISASNPRDAALAPELPNPKQSTYESPDAEPDAGSKMTPEEAEKRRAELLGQAQRDVAVHDLDAPLSDRDRVQTDPNGIPGMEALYGTGSSGPVDPEIARYITAVRQIVIPNWAPLPQIIQANPKLVTGVEVQLDDSGNVRDAKVHKPSGNTSFDASCLRAIQSSGRLPLPPQRFRTPGQTVIRVYLLASDAQ
jgi:TonB family protein